jgi:hypothetical protein
MQIWTKVLALGTLAVATAHTAQAQFVRNSPAGGALPAGVSEIGGIVTDLVGTNGARVVAQLAASTLFTGFSDTGTPVAFQGNPLTIGVQSGFGNLAALSAALGGGLQSAAFRVTLLDGDTRSGDFDFNENTFRVNGTDIQNFSTVQTVETSSTGTSPGNLGAGFGDDILNTGFFFTNNAGALTSIFTSLLGTGELRFALFDADPTDNFYDFTAGIDQAFINIGQGPVVIPTPGAVPEPSTYVMMATGLIAVVGIARRRRAA